MYVEYLGFNRPEYYHQHELPPLRDDDTSKDHYNCAEKRCIRPRKREPPKGMKALLNKNITGCDAVLDSRFAVSAPANYS